MLNKSVSARPLQDGDPDEFVPNLTAIAECGVCRKTSRTLGRRSKDWIPSAHRDQSPHLPLAPTT